MKKLITILLLVPILALGQTEKKSRQFIEINGGAAINGGAGGAWVEWFPGASILWGTTTQYNNNFVGEYQLGLAFPSIVTGKCAVGFGNLDYNLMLGLRPWPLFIGPQVKLGLLTFSAEWGARDYVISLETELILTAGIRLKIKSKEKKLKKIN
mgnify:FL=1|tara:strand:- start:53 stop:514 length:462 start_codon:yes stop_codon:yes gene_type:complete